MLTYAVYLHYLTGLQPSGIIEIHNCVRDAGVFLGMINFFHRFIPNAAVIIQRLYASIWTIHKEN